MMKDSRLIPILSSDVQRQQSPLAGLVRVGLLREEQLHDLNVSVFRGFVQRGGAICCLAVHIRTCSTTSETKKLLSSSS